MAESSVDLIGDEIVAMGEINDAYKRIVSWGLSANGSELTAAVHVVQGFVIQHMLARVDPDWSDWYQAPAQAEGTSEASPCGELPDFGHLPPFLHGTTRFETQPWRTGRKVGRTIYMQLGPEPSDDDVLIGVMDFAPLATLAVEAHNALLEAETEIARLNAVIAEHHKDFAAIDQVLTSGTSNKEMLAAIRTIVRPAGDTP
jgi:hypothetical protein